MLTAIIGFPIRFIPACAGNSILNVCSTSKDSVHPRVCGEQRDSYRSETDMDGSSPRVRGTDCVLPGWPAYARFIPACAGNSPLHGFTWLPLPVHPRVCGEQLIESWT